MIGAADILMKRRLRGDEIVTNRLRVSAVIEE
jgi:hypothetical protein